MREGHKDVTVTFTLPSVIENEDIVIFNITIHIIMIIITITSTTIIIIIIFIIVSLLLLSYKNKYIN